MFLTRHGSALPFVVEESAHAGVVRVAGKVIADIETVSGVKPALLRQAPDTSYVLCATLGCSAIADELIAQGKANLQAPWLGITAFVVLSVMLSLLVFIGEALRDAFDPRK